MTAGALDIGRWVHAYTEEQMIDTDLEFSTALINMYTKCGCIERAKKVFREMPVKDTKAWRKMIMVRIRGLEPTPCKTTYLQHDVMHVFWCSCRLKQRHFCFFPVG